MRRLTIILAVAALSLAACKKKDDDAGKGAGTAAPGAGTGTGTAAPGAGTGTAAMGAGTGTAMGPGGGAGTGTGAAAGAGMAGENKAGNCPSAVAGAVTAIVPDGKAGAVVLTITAPDAAQTETIRKRTSHLVEVQGAPDAEVKHSGEGTGGSTVGKCPVVTAKDVQLASENVDGGVKVTLTPSGATTVDALTKDVTDRIAKIGEWKDFKPTDTSGGGGGAGGGAGKHGGNHSGDGDGKGKEKTAPPGEAPVKSGTAPNAN